MRSEPPLLAPGVNLRYSDSRVREIRLSVGASGASTAIKVA